MITRESMILAANILKRDKVARILRAELTFTGHLRDRVRRSEVTLIAATATKNNHDNVDFIHYIGETMRGLGAQLIHREGVYYYRGVKRRDDSEGKGTA